MDQHQGDAAPRPPTGIEQQRGWPGRLRAVWRRLLRRFGWESGDVDPADRALIERLSSGPHRPPSEEFTDTVMREVRRRQSRRTR